MTEREQLEQAIVALESQRAILGDAVVSAALAPMREKLASLLVAEAPPAPPPRENQQRKQVTVLFADVSGFTAMSEKLDAEEVSVTMNALWSRLDAAILHQGGHIDKHIGDAVMALFGTPAAREDDPERAIRAALAMQQELATFLPAPDGQPRLRMRIGINTGPVLLGTIGTTGEYTAMGDTVNVASRLEHVAPIGAILISHDTYRHVRGVFDVAPQEPVRVKGKSEPLQVYVVRAAKPKAFRVTTRGVEGVETRTVGRERELNEMQAAFQDMLAERRAHLISLVAEAGTGKSRLLYEYTNWLELQAIRWRLFRGRATLEMSRVPFSLLRDVLAARFGIQDSDRAAVARDKLERGVVELVGGRHPEALVWAHFIGHLSGFDFSASPHLQGILGDARQIRDRAFYSLTQFFAAIAEDDPIVIMLEDIHWADEGSLEWVDHVLRTRPDLRLIVVGLARPVLFEQRPGWGDGPMTHVRLDLRPLSADDSRRLVFEILRKLPDVPAELVDLIVTRAEGSPFYMEELVKVLIDDGVILTDADEWRLEPHRLANLRVPATLTGILQARLDSLPAAERETLQQASVVGRVFWDAVVRRLQGAVAGPAPFNDRITALKQKELVFKREESLVADAQEYIFKHAILQEVTYESVLKRSRRAYHAQVAAALLDLAGDRADEHAGRIAEHYERAESWAEAATWYGRAGRRARATFAPQAAIDYFRKAIRAWEQLAEAEPRPLGERIDVYAGLGDALVVQARYREAIEVYTAMLALAEQAGDVPGKARAWHGLAQAHGNLGDGRAALEGAGQAEALARASGAYLELAQAVFMKGRALVRQGDFAAALAAGEEVVALATTLQDRSLRGRGLNLLGAVHNFLGQYQAAETCWEDARQIFEAAGDRTQTMSTLNNLGVVAAARGDNGLALRRYETALRLAREIGHRDGEIMFLGNVAEVRIMLGDYAAAEADLRLVIAAAESAGQYALSSYYRFLAEAHLGQGQAAEALAAGRHAWQLAHAAGNQEEYLVQAWRVLGRIASRLGTPIAVGEPDEQLAPLFRAEDCFAESLRLSLASGMEGERAQTLREWARHDLQHGDRQQGATRWQEARAIFAQIGLEQEAQRMAEMPPPDAAQSPTV